MALCAVTMAGPAIDNPVLRQQKNNKSTGSARLSSKLVLFGAIFAALPLSGCAAIPGFGPAPVDAFDISAPLNVPARRKLPRTQILVPTPTALKLLDSEDIAIRTGGGAMQLLGGARWSDRLTNLVQAKVIEAFQRSGSIGGVGRPGDGLAIDYQVVIEIRSFEVRVGQGGTNTAYVDLFVRLLNDRTGIVRASQNFPAVMPVGGQGSFAFTAALDQAFQKSAADIVAWTTLAI